MGQTGQHRYLIALGSNRRHHQHGRPERVIRAALADLATKRRLTVERVSPTLATAPLGPSRRRFANAAALVTTKLAPEALLAQLQAVERAFGRRRARRWGERVLDLDIILWSGGAHLGQALTIPHPAFRVRRFVLDPASTIAPTWRDPASGLTVRHLKAHLVKPRVSPLDPRHHAR